MAEMNRRMEALKPKAEPVDFFANPDEALQQRITPIEERYAAKESALRLSFSRKFAQIEHGKEFIAEMDQALERLPQGSPEWQSLSMRMRASDDPVGVAADWYRHHKIAIETGGDLKAYDKKVEEKLLKDPAFVARAVEAQRAMAQQNATQPGARPNIQLPPSINRATGSGASNAGSDDIDINDGRAMFNYANAGKPGRR
jgi:hypothetical protein